MTKPTDVAQSGRSIIEQNGYRLLTVSSEDDVKVISSPQRRHIFKILQMEGKPLHGKEIADRLGIKAPSAHFHLKKLEQIGAVRVSHTQVINGITARYYEAAVDGMIAGEDFLEPADDERIKQKLLFTARIFQEAKDSFIQALRKHMQTDAAAEPPPETRLIAAVDEVLYLSADETAVFYQEMEALLEKYAAPAPGKTAYSLFLSIAESHVGAS